MVRLDHLSIIKALIVTSKFVNDNRSIIIQIDENYEYIVTEKKLVLYSCLRPKMTID